MPKFFHFSTFNQHPIFDFFGFDSAGRVSGNHVCPDQHNFRVRLFNTHELIYENSISSSKFSDVTTVPEGMPFFEKYRLDRHRHPLKFTLVLFTMKAKAGLGEFVGQHAIRRRQ